MNPVKKVVTGIVFFLIFMTFPFPFHNSAYSKAKPPLCVRSDGNEISTAFNYRNGCDMRIAFSKGGINSILGLSSISSSRGNSRLEETAVDFNCDMLYKSHTDWLSPYIVKANRAGDNSAPAFTGGWHGVYSGQELNPTARTEKYSVYVDGKVLTPWKTIRCKKADIYVCNRIQAYNTTSAKSKREVLKETVHYAITKCRIDVSVVMEALEEITISRYYGLQTSNRIWDGRIYYESGIKKSSGRDIQKYSSSGAKKSFPNVNGYTLYSKDRNYALEVRINRKFGLGTMKYLSGDLPCAFTVGGGKSYFNLINGCPKIMKKGQKLSYKGCYIFK